MKVLVTGANGFVGHAVWRRLGQLDNFDVVGSMRCQETSRLCGGAHGLVKVAELSAETDWTDALRGVEVVVHTAARVHNMNETAADAASKYHIVNVRGTMRLAQQAAQAGVKRFVFLSSIKVNGEVTEAEVPFRESDAANPQDYYARSKHEAELGLEAVSNASGMELVVIRPPLVYGPGVRANFAALARAVRRGWPLPFGSVANKRSLVALDNLVDFVTTCVIHPSAANQTFLVSDGCDLSTRELVLGLARASNVSARLMSVPVGILVKGASLIRKKQAVLRLVGNLQVDISKARERLGWHPPVSIEEGLRRIFEVDRV